jgi:hypothetical protein
MRDTVRERIPVRKIETMRPIAAAVDEIAAALSFEKDPTALTWPSLTDFHLSGQAERGRLAESVGATENVGRTFCSQSR